MPASSPVRRPQRAIMELLKREGPSPAVSLARALKVSAMAVRQHLYALQEQKLVGFHEESVGVGRPAKRWKLTPEAERLFPDAHAELAVSLVEEVRFAFGAAGLEKIIQRRAAQQTSAYRAAVAAKRDPNAKVRALARLRTDEGYMAEVESEGEGSWLLVENHCPICSAARACTGLCQAELEVFRAALGPEFEIERTEHLLAGSRRCAYRMMYKGETQT